MLVEERPLISGALLKKMRPGWVALAWYHLKRFELFRKKLYLEAKLATGCIRDASIDFIYRLNPPSYVCPEVNPVGKPCAGKPHARFDERGWETGPCATAPFLESTSSWFWNERAETFNFCYQPVVLVTPIISSIVKETFTPSPWNFMISALGWYFPEWQVNTIIYFRHKYFCIRAIKTWD